MGEFSRSIIIAILLITSFIGFSVASSNAESTSGYVLYNGEYVPQEDYNVFMAKVASAKKLQEQNTQLYTNHDTVSAALGNFNKHELVAYVPTQSKESCSEKSKCQSVYRVQHPINDGVYLLGFIDFLFLNSSQVRNEEVAIGKITSNTINNASGESTFETVEWNSLEQAYIEPNSEYFVKITGSLNRNQKVDNILDIGGVHTYYEYAIWNYSDDVSFFMSMDNGDYSGSTMFDLAGFDDNGTMSSVTTNITSTLRGESTRYDGSSSQIDVDGIMCLAKEADWNLLLHLNVSTIPGSGDWDYFTGYWSPTDSGGGYFWMGLMENGSIEVHGAQRNSGVAFAFSNGVLSAGESYNISLRYNYSESTPTVYLRINGQENGSDTISTNYQWTRSASINALGYWYSGIWATRYNGDMDHVGCVDRLLTDDEEADFFSMDYPFVAESDAREFIEQAVNNTLTNHQILTDQQVYVRYLNGSQKVGAYDKFIKIGQKRWGFNYITENETPVGTWNISPAFYVLEMSNLTQSGILTAVENFILETK